MSKYNFWLILAIVVIAVGSGIFVVGMSFLNWDFSKLSTQKHITSTYEFDESFSSVSINVDTAYVTFTPSENGQTTVVCHELEKARHSVEIKDGALVVDFFDNRKWYDYIAISFAPIKIDVTIPQTVYDSLYLKTATGDIQIGENLAFLSATINTSTGDVNFGAQVSDQLKITTSTGNATIKNVNTKDVKVSTSTGNINVSSTSAESITANVSTGNATLSDIQCANLSSNGSTGNITLRNVIASQKINIERHTGNIKFDGCDAGEIQAKTSTGNITGTLLSSKIFIANSSTGDKKVPETTEGGICKLTTTTGDIRISIK